MALTVFAAWIVLTLAPTGSGPCTLIDADAGVVVRSDDGQLIPTGWTVQLQTSDRWVTAEGLGDTRFVALRLPKSGETRLLLRVTDAAGLVVTQDEVTVDVEPYSPNGEGCGPNVGRATLTVSPDGEVA